MSTHRLLNWVLVLAMVLSLTACGPSEEPKEELSPPVDSSQPAEPAPVPQTPFTLAFYPDYSIHPALAANRANLALAPLLYEGLFSLDNTFTPAPVLCQSYSVSEDGLSWSFVLQPGVTFSDGTPLTGEIAADSLRTALGPGSQYSGRLREVKAISGSDNILTIELTRPNGALPTLLDIPLALGAGDRPLGTGPYVFSDGAAGPTLTARTDWWQKEELSFDRIRLFCIQEADDLIAAFDSGDITLLDTDLTGTNALGYSGSYQVWDYNTTDFLFLGMNTVHGYCRFPEVRQAIGKAIDRESIATIPYARHARASTLPIHPDSPLYDDTLASMAGYAPDVLVRTMEQHPIGGHPLILLVNSENNDKLAAAEYIVYQLEAAGLPAQVRKLPWDEYLNALAAGNFDFYLGEVLLTADFDLTALVASGGHLNYTGWADPQTDALISALRAAPPAQRPQAALDLCTYLDQQAPILPICFKHGSVLTQWGRVTGLRPRQNNIFNGMIP